VLDYCLHAGSENVVIYFRDNLYVIKTLREFQYVDEYGKDQGANVRQKAKDIVNLLQDEARLRHERKSRASMRDRMISGRNNYDEDVDNENSRRRSRSVPPKARGGRDDDQLRRAIEESKRTAEQEAERLGRMTAEERDLAQAIQLSKEDEDKRNKAVEDANANSLFDDANQLYVFAMLLYYVESKWSPTQLSAPAGRIWAHRSHGVRNWPPASIYSYSAAVHGL
jgi:epsin